MLFQQLCVIVYRKNTKNKIISNTLKQISRDDSRRFYLLRNEVLIVRVIFLLFIIILVRTKNRLLAQLPSKDSKIIILNETQESFQYLYSISIQVLDKRLFQKEIGFLGVHILQFLLNFRLIIQRNCQQMFLRPIKNKQLIKILKTKGITQFRILKNLKNQFWLKKHLIQRRIRYLSQIQSFQEYNQQNSLCKIIILSE